MAINSIIKILDWVFSKKSLPYWCLILVDCISILLSCLFTYWVLNRTLDIFEHRFAVLYTSLFYAAIYLIGARCFHTYLGVVRYSSFVDLLRVFYANALSLVIALIVSLICEHYRLEAFCGGCVKIDTSFFYRKAPTFSSQGFVMSKIFCTFGPSS